MAPYRPRGLADAFPECLRSTWNAIGLSGIPGNRIDSRPSLWSVPVIPERRRPGGFYFVPRLFPIW